MHDCCDLTNLWSFSLAGGPFQKEAFEGATYFSVGVNMHKMRKAKALILNKLLILQQRYLVSEFYPKHMANCLVQILFQLLLSNYYRNKKTKEINQFLLKSLKIYQNQEFSTQNNNLLFCTIYSPFHGSVLGPTRLHST